MDIQELKKLLAGFGIAGLVAGAGLTLGATAITAASGWGGSKSGTGVTTKQTSTQSSWGGTTAEPASEPTPTGSWSGSKTKPAQPAPSGSWSGSK